MSSFTIQHYLRHSEHNYTKIPSLLFTRSLMLQFVYIMQNRILRQDERGRGGGGGLPIEITIIPNFHDFVDIFPRIFYSFFNVSVLLISVHK